ncbi:synaptotagmin-14b [Engraulis encrasicolus]|uniref:synaptotagmin-14b n=1 Tax=Engraulis encrasicolus TaxID=184585 RepID=UPI002FD01FE9
MAFFKSFQQNLPTINVTSLLDSVSSKVDDLSMAVSDATYTVSDQLTEKVSTIISKVEEERARKAEEAEEAELAAQAAAEEEEERSASGRGKLRRQEQQSSPDPGDQSSSFLSKGRSWFSGGQQQQEEERKQREEEKRRKEEEKRRKEEERRRAQEAEEEEEQNIEEEEEDDECSRRNKFRKGTEQGSSESEEERPWTQPQRASGWGNNGSTKQSEKEAYNSRAPVVQANSVERPRHPSQLNELQPPPYRASSQQQSRHQSRAQDSEEEEESEEEEDEEEEESEEEESDDPDMQKEDAPSDSTAVLGPEDSGVPPLPAGYEPEALGKYGTLDVAFEYESCEQRLAVTVTAATDIPELKSTGNVSWQVHLVLLPTKKQRAKTGVQKGPCPVFTETFRFSRVEQEALCNYAVRFRLYSVRRMKKEKVLGEKVFYLTKLNLEGKTALPVTLEPGSSATGCGSMVSVSRSMGALSYHSTGESATPELLLGLLYNSTTGRLCAEIIKGTHFKNSASEKLPIGLFCCVKQCIGGQLYIMRDTYVKLMMLDSKGKQMSKCKTSVCRGQPSPTYKETFMFPVALFQLSEVTLHVSVYSRRSSVKRRERLGWVALGLNSTSEEQEEHWTHMREAEGQQICQWHTLMGT